MKITKLLLASAGIAAMGMGMTSCLGTHNNDGLEYTQNFSSFFNVVFSSSADEPTYQNGIGYQVKYNMTNSVANLQIDGLSVNGTTYTTLTADKLPWTYYYGWSKITATSFTPNSLTLAPTFTNFNFDVMDRYVLNSTTYYPCLNINYVLNGEYYVISMPTGVINEGTTVVTDKDGNQYTTTNNDNTFPTYAIQLLPSTTANLNNASERKAMITMNNFQFSVNSENKNFVIKDIPYDVERSGLISLSIDNAQLQTVVGSGSSTVYSTYKDYTVSDFMCTTNTANVMDLTFTVTSAEDDVEYRVVCRCVTPVYSSTTTN